MKKISILIAVILWTGAALFGETGYESYKWYADRSQVETSLGSNLKQLPTEDYNILGNKVVLGNEVIQNTKTDIVFYFEAARRLKGISFITTNKKAENIKQQFKKENFIFKIPTLKEIDKYCFLYDLCLNSESIKQFGNAAINDYFEGKELTESEGTLSIYDYNDDTRVYIYENIIEGQTVVVYVPHEQDY